MTTEPAAAANVPDGDEAVAEDEGATPPDGTGAATTDGGPLGGFGLGKAVALGLALAFLVGAAGYFIGVRTASPPTSAVDEGFLQDMSDHHDQAVDMALLAQTKATDPIVRDFATEIVLFQRRELGLMQAYQQERGILAAEYDPDRITMTWMDMAEPLSSMYGMASPEQLDALEAATGTDFDIMFLQLMQTHHRGGVHMAEYARDNAADPKIRTLAERMARNQAAEISEFQGVIDRLSGS